MFNNLLHKENLMSRVCEFCQKRTVAGRSIARRGLAKKKKGVGKKTTGITKRTFKPNIHRIKVEINGGVKRVKICTKCLKSDKITKPTLKK